MNPGRDAAWVLLAQSGALQPHCILSPLVLVEDLVGWAEVGRDAGESHGMEYQGRTKTRSAFWKGLPSPAEETEAGVHVGGSCRCSSQSWWGFGPGEE